MNSFQDTEKNRFKKRGQEKTAGITLIIIVALMTCIFSTLDNAVTLVHAEGSVDIGQTPRVILAVSGLVSLALMRLERQ